MRSPTAFSCFSMVPSSAAPAACTAGAAQAASAMKAMTGLNMVLLPRPGLVGDGIVVVVRHHLQLREGLVHHGGRLVRRELLAGGLHREGLAAPARVVVAPEGHV